jgi:5-formyltetrahydrofolate cyclo-ligase
VQQVRNLSEYQNARVVSIFLSMPGKEVSTRDIVLDAFSQGKAVYVPYIYTVGGAKSKDKVMDMLKLRDQTDFDSLVPDSWGIPSLDKGSVTQRGNALGGAGLLRDAEAPSDALPDLDLIFMPAVAFDQSRNRLGHGKGFYDRYLHKYHAATARSGRSMPKLGRPLFCTPKITATS